MSTRLLRSPAPRVLPVLPMLLALLAGCGTTAPNFESSTTPEERAALLARVEQFDRSIREGDKQGYADVFTDDFVFTWSRNGQIYDRESILPNVVPTPEYEPLVDQVLVRQYGDAAIVNFRVRKQEGDAGARVTFSYARIGDAWKVMASHSTKIVEPEGAAD